MQNIALTNERRTEFRTVAVTVSCPDALTMWLAPLVRKSTRPLTVANVATMVAAFPDGTGKRPADVMVVVAKFHVDIATPTGFFERLIVGDKKPSINQIRDNRTRPAPFLRDGTCRG